MTFHNSSKTISSTEEEEKLLLLEEDTLMLLEDDEEILIIEEDTRQESQEQEPWKMMIVDDDSAVHQATELALKNFVFHNKPLSLIHAFSGVEAQKLMLEHADVVLILLDVVMESDNAGLDVVRYVRDDLNNKQVQIILRTGQPGEAPEEEVIRNYEINDYKLKVELTRQRLITAVIAALRAYCNIIAVEEKTTELTQTLKTLQQTQLQLVQSEKMSALGNLVAGIAHEINNPTGFLRGNIQPARDYVQDLLGLIDLYQSEYPQPNKDLEAEIEKIDLEFIREDLPKLIGSMALGVERICNISNSLCTFSRQDQEHKTFFNIHEGIESTLLILKHRTKANEQRPQIQILKDYGEVPEVQCFPGQLNQVFMNLIANAIDAGEEDNQGKTYAEIEANLNIITIQTAVIDRAVKITIQDNGCGMTPEIQEMIFDQGFTTKDVGKGTGLGMAIARQIVETKHGGTLTCTSELGKGTEFVITIPISP